MIDVNAEAEKTLANLDCTVDYYHPDEFTALPIVTFYNLAEKPAFATDNAEDIQNGTIVVDVWSRDPEECGRISIEVNNIMTADGWYREFSRDMPPDGGIYHRTMRLTKDFYLEEE